eukprot:10594264-Lingulodinium_polyedra.AAC.1
MRAPRWFGGVVLEVSVFCVCAASAIPGAGRPPHASVCSETVGEPELERSACERASRPGRRPLPDAPACSETGGGRGGSNS